MRLPVSLSLLAAAISAASTAAAQISAPVMGSSPLIAEAAQAAAPGDVVFKSGEAFWGRLAARFSPTEEGWGHVGIAALDSNGALIVIHAGGDPLSPQGRVQETPFAAFIGPSQAFALYRPVMEAARIGAAIEYAAAAAARNAPFDVGFSLDTEEDFYCTELVWRALSVALGEDAVPDKSRKAGRVFLAIADLQQSPWLEERWSSRRAEAASSAAE